MTRSIWMCAALSFGAGCAVSDDLAADPLAGELLAPPGLVLATSDVPVAGEDLLLTVTLPAAVSGKQTYFLTSTAGAGVDVGACPALLAGDCLDISNPFTIEGSALSVAGESSFVLGVPSTAGGSSVWVQAVVVHNGRGFPSNVVQLDVEEVDDGQLTLANCAQSYTASVPAFYQNYFACVDATTTATGTALWTDGLPPHPSPYYATSNPNYVPFDTRGGTHFRNPNTLAAQNTTITVPNNPVAKGISITAALVDNTMNTSTEEYSGGPVGVSLNGVLIFAAMAAPGDDLSEEQYTFDLYEAHPANTTYHYHFETPGPLEVLVDRGYSATSLPGEGEVELYGIMCDGTVVMGCTELDGSAPFIGDLDAQNGHVHDLTDGVTTHFVNRYHTHVCTSQWPTYPFFPEIAYYQETSCPSGPPR